jgi:thiol-disulfide isomerase/thioredoxin
VIAPDDIDLEFAPRLLDDLFEVEIDSELLVVGGTSKVVSLNPTGAMLFPFFDGESTLEELVDDLSDALGVDPAQVESDVLAFAKQLGHRGLLQGVENPGPEVTDGGWTAPNVLDVGDAVDDFTLPDLEGTARSLSDLRGRRVLLVNWSPGCGYCLAIAEELGRLDAALAERNAALVFLAAGDAEANRRVFADADVHALTLVRDGTEVDPFGGTGTPAAYLLDETGRVAASMVVGSDQVPVLARDLAGVDAPDPDDAGGVDTGVRYLPAPGAMCGAGGGGGGATGWAGTRAYRFGDHHVGVRYDTDATADVLDRLFPGARVTDHRVPDNYSVALDATPAGAGTRALHLLVRGSTQLVRTRVPGRVLAGLVSHLSADFAAPDDRLQRVSATAVVHDGHGVLLPPHLVNHLQELQPRFSRAGIRMVDGTHADIDLDAGELVVPSPTIAFDASVVAELEGEDSSRRGGGSELPRVLPGRYPLRAWCFSRSPEQSGPLSPATAVTAALSSLLDLADDEIPATVAALVALFARVPAVGVWFDQPAEFVDQVVKVVG